MARKPRTPSTPPGQQPPATPTGLTATAISQTQINLAWSPAARATDYFVIRNQTRIATVISTSYSDTGLSPGTTYGYQVQADNKRGTSAPTAVVRCATQSPPPPQPTPPNPPTGLDGQAVSTSQINLSWNPVISATGYTVLRDGSAAGTTTDTTYIDGGLEAGTTYSYQVTATNEGGTSVPSATFQVDTLGPIAIQPPPALGGPVVVAGASVTYTIGGSPVVLDSTLTVSDPSSSTLANATISIGTGFNTLDSLNFVNQFGITGSYNSSTGVLSLTGTDTLAHYQTALQSITFSSTVTSAGSRVIDWTVNDGTQSSPTVTSSVTVAAAGSGLAVAEVTTVSPTIICIEVLDARTTTPGVISASQFMGRHATDVVANWPAISVSTGGSITVTQVGRLSLPWSQDFSSTPATSNYTMQRHYLFLTLSAAIVSGTTYTISFPTGANIAGPYSFAFNDKTTVCHALHATQVGHRPSDDNKLAYLKIWLPYTSPQTIDYIGGLGLTTFHVLDNTGAIVFTGNTTTAGILQPEQFYTRNTPTTNDTTNWTQGPGCTSALGADLTQQKPIQNITYPTTGPNAGKVVVQCNGHGMTAGTKFYLTGICSGYTTNPGNPQFNPHFLNQYFNSSNNFANTVGTVIDANNFTVNDNASTPVALAPPTAPITITASITGGTNLVVTATSGSIPNGWYVAATAGAGIVAIGTQIVSGPGGGTGTYTITPSQSSVASQTMQVQFGGTSNSSNDGVYYAQGIMEPEYDSRLIPITRQQNSSNAFCHGLDYSAWTTGNGTGYRLHIPGLGVSYPFDCNDANVYLNSAKVSCAGYYHQLNGLALDGRYGWTHPACFIDGVTPNGPGGSTAIYWSTTPGLMSSECQYGNPATDTANYWQGFGATASTLTSTRATGIYGGYRDAGDWATICWSHALATYSLLAMDEAMQAWGAPNTSFNFPRMASVLDPTLYAGTNGMNDCVHQAMWEIDFYRRTQQADGRVAGGIGFDDAGQGDGTNNGTPSWTNPNGNYVFLLAADHASNFAAAMLFAKASERFAARGFTTLASTYKTAAINAFAWADNLYGNITNETAYYGTTLNWTNTAVNKNNGIGSATTVASSATVTVPTGSLTAGSSWIGITGNGGAFPPIGIFKVATIIDSTHCTVTPTPTVSGTGNCYLCGLPNFSSQMAAMDSDGSNGDAAMARYAACGALFRITGTSSYRTQIENNPFIGGTAYWRCVGEWEYVNCTIGGALNGNVINGFNGVLTYSNLLNSAEQLDIDPKTAFNTQQGWLWYGKCLAMVPFIYGVWQHVGFPGMSSSIDATWKTRLRRMWQAYLQNLQGANQFRTCWTSGLGTRQVLWGTVNRDREAQGIQNPIGYTNYVFGGGFTFLNLAFGGGPITFTNMNTALDSLGAYPGIQNPGKGLWPDLYAVPFYVWIVQDSYMIGMMEYTTEESIIPNQMVSQFLQSWDGN